MESRSDESIYSGKVWLVGYVAFCQITVVISVKKDKWTECVF